MVSTIQKRRYITTMSSIATHIFRSEVLVAVTCTNFTSVGQSGSEKSFIYKIISRVY